MTSKSDGDSPALWFGMSLRDWFAGQAMAGFIASYDGEQCSPSPGTAAQYAYQIADAMLLERNAASRAEGTGTA